MHVSLGFMVYNNHPSPQTPRSRVVIDLKSQSVMHYLLNESFVQTTIFT